MNFSVRPRANYSRCVADISCSPISWTSNIILPILIGITCFASTNIIVSGFLPYYSLHLPSQQEFSEQQECICTKDTKSNSCKLRKWWRRITWLQAEVDRCGDDYDFTTVEMNDILDRRQTLATLVVSSAALFSMPTTAFANENNTKNMYSRTSEVGAVKVTSISESIESSKTKLPSFEQSSFQESVSGFVAGAAIGGTKTLVKFPLDTATVRVQMPNSGYSIRDPVGLFKGCFNGVSFPLLSNIPAGAIFFGVKDAVKVAMKNSDGPISTMPRWLSTSLAVGIAQIPYWLVRNPSEVVKVRQQANVDGYGEDVSAIDAVKKTFKSGNKDEVEANNVSDFYTGYWENFLYAYPADVIKFVAYESITKGRKDLSPFEGAKAGAVATALAQIITTPLDVVRNRLMTGNNGTDNGSSLSQDEENEGYIGSLVTLGQEEGLSGLFAGVTPRASKAILSGAIQFATYEETKQSISNILLRRVNPFQ